MAEEDENVDENIENEEPIENESDAGVEDSVGGGEAEEQSAVEKAQEIQQKATRLKATATKIANKITTTFPKIISILVNPWFWVVTAVIAVIFIIIMAAMAFYSSVGKNEDDCGMEIAQCSSVNLHTGENLTEEQIKENAFMIMGWLMSTPFEVNGGKPMSKEQAAGLVGNMKEETGSFNPARIQDGKLPPTATNEEVAALIAGHTSSNAGAVGLFQQRQDRAKKMLEIATSSNRQWNDAAVQLEHFKYELDKPEYHGQLLRDSKFFEPGLTAREYTEYANKYFGSFRFVAGVPGAGNGSNTEGIDPAKGGEAGERAAAYAEMLIKEYTPTNNGCSGGTSGGGSLVADGSGSHGLTLSGTAGQYFRQNELPDNLKQYVVNLEGLDLQQGNCNKPWIDAAGTSNHYLLGQCVALSKTWFHVVWEKDGKHEFADYGNGIDTAPNTAAKFGGKTTKVPTKGAIASATSLSGNSAGHTFIVEHVFENGDILLTEQNAINGAATGTACEWSYRVQSKAGYESLNTVFFDPASVGFTVDPKVGSGFGGTPSNDSCSAKSNSNADYAGIIELAKSVAKGKTGDSWTKEPCTSGGAGPEHIDARKKQIEAGLGIGEANGCSTDDYADCGKAVATIITLLVDKDYPVAGTYIQEPYVQGSSNWTSVSNNSDLKTGDVLFSPGHTWMYLGDVDGKKNVVYEASLDDYFPYIHEDNYRTVGGSIRAYHYTGPANNGALKK